MGQIDNLVRDRLADLDDARDELRGLIFRMRLCWSVLLGSFGLITVASVASAFSAHVAIVLPLWILSPIFLILGIIVIFTAYIGGRDDHSLQERIRYKHKEVRRAERSYQAAMARYLEEK